MNTNKWSTLPPKDVIENTIKALKSSGITSYYTEKEEDAVAKVFELLPEGAEVMNMTSVTCDTLGITKTITESGKYNAVRNKLNAMDKKTQGMEMQKLGAAPDYVIGSVHAVTQDGKVVIASASGSQLPAYAYGSAHVIWVVGAQKIVKDFDEALKRIYEYTFLLENERAKKVYGMGSNVSKLLVVNKEFQENRISIVFVNKVLGF